MYYITLLTWSLILSMSLSVWNCHIQLVHVNYLCHYYDNMTDVTKFNCIINIVKVSYPESWCVDLHFKHIAWYTKLKIRWYFIIYAMWMSDCKFVTIFIMVIHARPKSYNYNFWGDAYALHWCFISKRILNAFAWI